MRDDLVASIRSRLVRFQDTRDAAAVLGDDALAEAAALWAAVPEPGENLQVVQLLGLLRWYRFVAGDNDEDLNAAASLLRPVFIADPRLVPEALRAYFTQADDRPNLGDQSNQAVALMRRYQQTGDLAVLAEAIGLWQHLADIAPADDPVLVAVLPNLAIAQRRYFDRTGDLDALTSAIETGRRAVAVTPTSDPFTQVSALTGLSNSLRRLSARTGDADALAEAIEAARSAIAAATAASDQRLLNVARNSLANALHNQWGKTSDQATLTEVVQMYRDVAATISPEAADAAAVWSNLCDSLHDMYWNTTGDRATLAEAISAGRQAVALADGRRDEQARYLCNLGSTVLRMFERAGDPAMLDEAVDLIRRAVAQTEDEHPELPKYLNDLSTALLRVYENRGDLGQLEEAVTAAGRAAESRQDSSYSSTLAICLRALYERTGDSEALAGAEQAARDALAIRGGPPEPALLSNLGGILVRQFEDTRDRGFLSEAVQVLRDAVAVVPAGHHDQDLYQSQLGSALAALYWRDRDPDVLAEAIAVARSSVAADRAENPARASYLRNLGQLLELQESFGEARDVYAEAAALPTAPVSARVGAAHRWGICALKRGDSADALAAFEEAIARLPQIVSRRLSVDDREYGLEQVAALASDAAAAAVACGRPERAVELLEQSRGLLFDQAMESHRDLGEIRALAPGLADEYEALRREIDVLDRPHDGEADFISKARRDLDARWHALIGRIRETPGLAGFLQPLPIQTLQEQAADGPIVMVYTTRWRSDALVLTADAQQPVTVVSLPKLAPSEAAEQAIRLLEAHSAAIDGQSSVGQRHRAQAELSAVLGWLWETVAGPVCEAIQPALDTAAAAAAARIWWCPVGALTFLPLHAAGRHDGSGSAVIDHVISSYTVTIRALRDVRQRPAQSGAGNAEVLIVAVADTGDAEPLAGVRAEVADLIDLLPNVTVLTAGNATRERVLEALPHHAAAHFACHGISDWQAPRESRLILSDHSAAPLTVAEISGLDLAHAELAYLSACSTTMATPRVPDEAIHITGACQLAGYRHVIGTLWPVDDQVARRLAKAVYSDLTDNGRTFPRAERAAQALWAATRALRDAHPASPGTWIAQVHVGT